MFYIRVIVVGLFQVGTPHVSHHSELLAWVNAKLNRLLGRAAAPAESSAAAAEKAGSEQKRRRAQAAARRARILGQMQAQQKKFITQNVTALDTEPEEAGLEAAAEAVTGSAMDLSECAGADEWPVCLGPRQSARPAAPAEYTCILCQASEQVSSTRPAMVMAAFVQLSTVLSRERSSSAANPVLYVPSSLHRLPHTSSCGHVMHAACWQRHFESVARDRRAHPRYDTHHSAAACSVVILGKCVVHCLCLMLAMSTATDARTVIK